MKGGRKENVKRHFQWSYNRYAKLRRFKHSSSHMDLIKVSLPFRIYSLMPITLQVSTSQCFCIEMITLETWSVPNCGAVSPPCKTTPTPHSCFLGVEQSHSAGLATWVASLGRYVIPSNLFKSRKHNSPRLNTLIRSCFVCWRSDCWQLLQHSSSQSPPPLRRAILPAE